MIMAGGLGTRLKPFTAVCPKPMMPVLGVPVAQFLLDQLQASRCPKAVVNLHHLPEKAKDGWNTLERGQMDLVFSDESSLLLGSAGGIKQAEKLFEPGPIFLANADVIFNVNWAALAERHAQLKKAHGVTITLTVLPGTTQGSYRELKMDFDRGLVTGLGEVKPRKAYYAGVAVLEPEAWANVPAGEPSEFVPQILEPAIRAGKVGTYLASGLWLDIGSPEAWLTAHFELLRRWEAHQLPPIIERRISRRLRYVRPGIVTGPGAGDLTEAAFKEWEAPAFWWPGAGGAEAVPQKLGPHAIIYGDATGADSSCGIGFEGAWVSLGG